MSLTGGVGTLRALCQEREQAGSSRSSHSTETQDFASLQTHRDSLGDKKTREPTLTIDSLLGGGYLLSHFRSTIGVVRLNFSVRNGKRWDPHAMTTLFSLTARTAHLACGAAVMALKRPSMGTLARKPSSRFHFRVSRNHRACPSSFYLSA